VVPFYLFPFILLAVTPPAVNYTAPPFLGSFEGVLGRYCSTHFTGVVGSPGANFEDFVSLVHPSLSRLRFNLGAHLFIPVQFVSVIPFPKTHDAAQDNVDALSSQYTQTKSSPFLAWLVETVEGISSLLFSLCRPLGKLTPLKGVFLESQRVN